MSDNIIYKLRSGKPIKALWFAQKTLGLAVPDAWYRHRRAHLLAKARQRADYDEMCRRVDYYCRINAPWQMSTEDNVQRDRSWLMYTGALGDYGRELFHTAYYFDQHDVTRWFDKRLRWNFCPGDVYFTPEKPTVMKSRLINDDKIGRAHV